MVVDKSKPRKRRAEDDVEPDEALSKTKRSRVEHEDDIIAL